MRISDWSSDVCSSDLDSDEFAARIFRQIEGFGSYGFPESHAASFALLAYKSAWLKRHRPAAFICGLINAQPMGFYPVSMLVAEARRSGVEVRAVDVQHSRSEEHTSELQSLMRISYAVFCLTKKNKNDQPYNQ